MYRGEHRASFHQGQNTKGPGPNKCRVFSPLAQDTLKFSEDGTIGVGNRLSQKGCAFPLGNERAEQHAKLVIGALHGAGQTHAHLFDCCRRIGRARGGKHSDDRLGQHLHHRHTDGLFASRKVMVGRSFWGLRQDKNFADSHPVIAVSPKKGKRCFEDALSGG